MLIWKPLLRDRAGQHITGSDGQPKRAATYSYKFEWKGRQIARRTEHTNERAARQAAQRHLEAERAGITAQADALLRQRAAPSTITLGTIYKLARQLAGQKPKTLDTYEFAWSRILARIAPGTKPEDFPLHRLTAKLADDFKRLVELDVLELPEEDQGSALRSANSYLRNACALFKPDRRAAYALRHGIELPPTLTGFLETRTLPGAGKVEWHKPSDAIICATMESLAGLREKDPNLYLAVWLAIGTGCRKSEASAALGSWIEHLHGIPHLKLNKKTKNKSVGVQITITNGAWDHIAPLLPSNPTAPLLTGNKTEREGEVFRRCSDWMRALGWETQKAYHEFRALGGCQVLNRDGIFKASQWLRHSTVVVTQEFYGRYADATVTQGDFILPAANILPFAAAAR